jgi:hypothetical protein
MQSKTSRSVRHLLVSSGVVSLVLSVAAPAALADADKSKGNSEPKNEHADNTGTGAERIKICHNGRVIEVDDDGELGGHSKHGDSPVGTEEQEKSCTGAVDQTFEEGDELVKLCLAGQLEEIFESERTDDHVDPVLSEEEDLTCPDEIIVDGGKTTVCVEGVLTEVIEVPEGAVAPLESEDGLTCPGEIIFGGGDKVEVCHQGAVIQIAAEALEEHLGHGDAEMVEAVSCPAVILDEEIDVELDIDPVVLDEREVVVEVPVKNTPAAPAQPIPAAQPRPVVTISADTITKPAAGQSEVLGAVTSRTPTPGAGALDPGTRTAASITALAATGADGTKVLAAVGAILLLSGFGLQVSGRRRMRSATVEA